MFRARKRRRTGRALGRSPDVAASPINFVHAVGVSAWHGMTNNDDPRGR